MYQFILECIEQNPVSSHFKFNRGKFTAATVHMSYYPMSYIKNYYSDMSYYYSDMHQILII